MSSYIGEVLPTKAGQWRWELKRDGEPYANGAGYPSQETASDGLDRYIDDLNLNDEVLILGAYPSKPSLPGGTQQ